MDGLERVLDSGRRVSHGLSGSRSRNSWGVEDVFARSSRSRMSGRVDDDEEALRWAALEKLPTYDRLRTTIMKSFLENDQEQGNKLVHKEVDVRKLDMNDRQQFIERIFKVAEEDNEKFLRKLRNRIDRGFLHFYSDQDFAEAAGGKESIKSQENKKLLKIRLDGLGASSFTELGAVYFSITSHSRNCPPWIY
ncbi:hypothetical protein NE237_024540 [Protea cynaroides]|uniref:Uncharacterized protein n=1 Tax=Protea cynaroides TaxID=273540 RepID=A0A9Q0H5C7_9MAGN|nr:hypothetical protein NE237_024540 [Protea cynaroides]